MKKLSIGYIAMLFISLFLTLNSCNKEDQKVNTNLLAINTEIKNESKETSENLSEEFKKYWYAGEAEITSYKLEQARYGQLRDGGAVLIYVTEDFLPEKQVKADRQNSSNIPVMKLNSTKNFNTGVYPYSIMQSAFYPVSNDRHAIKVSSSVQEWCGQQYSQLNNRDKFEIVSHSYFEREADNEITIDKAILENELWSKLRINPSSLPTGNIKIIPSLEYIRLSHRPTKAYDAIAKMNNGSYSIEYPELKRTLTINFNTEFPYEILGWTESEQRRGQILTSTATKIATLKSAYWGKNSNKDGNLREILQLD